MDHFIGADTGGTFTDLVIIDSEGNLTFEKAMSNRQDPGKGVRNALASGAELIDSDVSTLLASTLRFAHGTTVGTNALIERKGALVGLICDAGFEDTLRIARGPLGRNLGVPITQALDFIHNPNPPPLIPRERIRGVLGRVASDGVEVEPIDEDEVMRALKELAELGVDSVAVCKLWSFLNPAHERRIGEIAREQFPDLPISLSSEVSPVLGEFERTLTTAVNAFVGPPIRAYIERLNDGLAAGGLRHSLQVMKCSGGLTLPQNVEREAAAIINSGPVGGLVAAQYLSQVLGYDNVVTSDMGGTSFDVGLIREGEFEYDAEPCLDQGLPVQTPAVKVVTVGAGGGSIAWTDGDRLLVGPHSAGADPGPACYGKGHEPTVTDVLVVLGILSPDNFFGGRKLLDVERAREAIGRVAEPLGLGIRETAEGIYEIVTARMADLIRKVTVENGYDPRRFALLAYGGAGPAHAALYAKHLGIRDVIIPPSSSVFSALGCALSDVKYSYARSEPLVLDAADPDSFMRFNTTLEELEEVALADVDASGRNRDEVTLRRTLDVRYRAQMNELTVPWTGGVLDGSSFDVVRSRFETAYEGRYGQGTTRSESPLEVITFRVDAIVPTVKPELKSEPLGPADASAAISGTRMVSLRHIGELEHTVYRGDELAPGHEIKGPAVIERRDTTVLLPIGNTATVDTYGNVHIHVNSGDDQ
ncbi:MAG: hydantoinase/oxoprolinase family protein [Actinobacteria bacterium]|nr:hydantoinase/oxoprolinase family protein [Actinomycetota bacterium]